MRRPSARATTIAVIGALAAAGTVSAAALLWSAGRGGENVADARRAQPGERRAAFLDFTADLETGDFSQFEDLDAARHELAVVTNPVRAGRYAARALVNQGEKDVGGPKYRAEATSNGAGGANQERERWFGFSTYLPNDWRVIDRGNDVLFQVHEQPDACENWRSPPLSLRVVEDRMEWQVIWDARRCTERTPTETVIADRPIVLGRWVDWVVHVRWSYRRDGLVQVWQDGEQIADYGGPNAYNDGQPMFLKIGVYRSGGPWPAGLRRRVVYFDEFRMAGAGGAYSDVVAGNAE